MSAWETRLRSAKFIDPDGVEHDILFDDQNRSGGKKGGTQEIIDSDKSVSRDQGNKAKTFRLPVYFVGSEFDIEADKFVASLDKKYSLESPGVLVHPRWGDINVFPFEYTQSENLVRGKQISKIDVNLTEVFSFDAVSEVDQDGDTSKDMDELSGATDDSNFLTDSIEAYNNLKRRLATALGRVKSALRSVASVSNAVVDEFDSIATSASNLIDSSATAVIGTLQATQRLINLPNKIRDRTISQIDTYSEMVNDLVTEISGDTGNMTKTDQKNSAAMAQFIAGYAVAATADAATKVNFRSRAEAISAIKKIDETTEIFQENFDLLRTSGDANLIYVGDHNFYFIMLRVINKVKNYILLTAFNLKIEKRIILRNESDPVSLCYEHYGKIDQLTMDLFFVTNEIKGSEFISIPAGREIVIYA